MYKDTSHNITVHLYKKDMLENITVHLYKDMLHNITVHLYKDMHDNQGHLNSIIVPLPFPWSKQRPGANIYTTTHRNKNVNGP